MTESASASQPDPVTAIGETDLFDDPMVRRIKAVVDDFQPHRAETRGFC